jgi:hypothetical protein
MTASDYCKQCNAPHAPSIYEDGLAAQKTNEGANNETV